MESHEIGDGASRHSAHDARHFEPWHPNQGKHPLHASGRSVPDARPIRPALPVRAPWRNSIATGCAYIVFTLIYGVLFIMFDKAPAQNDGANQWLRALQVASGQIRAIPNPADPSQFGGLDAAGHFQAFNNTAAYSPFLYFPSLLGTGNYMTASIMTLVSCALITGFAIAISAELSSLLAISALLPTAFLSYLFPTADAVTNAIAFLFIGFVFMLRRSTRHRHWVLLGLTIAAFLLGCTKPTSLALLIILPLGIAPRAVTPPAVAPPAKRKAAAYAALALPALCAVIPALLWQHAVRMIAPGAKSLSEMSGISHQLMAHPWLLVRTIIKSSVNPLNHSVESVDNIGRNVELAVGSQDTMLPLTIMAPILLAFVLVGLQTAHQLNLRVPEKLTAFASVAVFFSLICLAMILIWVGKLGGYAEGMQGRYFVPCLPLVMLFMPTAGMHAQDSARLNRIVAALIAITYIGMFVAHMIPANIH
ncbi:MAG: DUF2142 domain-containing protein [Bifidobacterium tibiigranuli]|jgi:uncharacterized membrane protein|uniref:DUF2142 domain-containing protein n=1 Tax=Bifidobacterium tibiigranuli TaxID=2172043 RepID=UPI00235242DD|nr:DUF2142 domain-containing protein [Bifidobacterium tibiigranuli]MCH3975788.1 DUF2142 domain-containing protein [Bifidobacterium tibiigranuli]MCH4189292.1 DUF2142 domain-containing protein [Bifidobacterium tibiigranuli]MCH4203073.1 DUF2142 domain-containing protein [Bifidobacterium tibiigranuli]MCH4274778.1 DUF2142 domain-containing protein [Bifidobacterium tibiigranuli]MCI1792375.1 DUF2142 domain-containing protein [Bifidobacterium tibiigranuli]